MPQYLVPKPTAPGAAEDEWMSRFTFGKKDVRTKKPWYTDLIDESIGMLRDESQRLQGVEESRGADMERIVKQSVEGANVPTMTDAQINAAFGMKADEASREYLSGLSALRSYLGGAGITGGGHAAGLASQYGLARQGQMTDARRGLFLERVKQDALDRQRNLQNRLVYAQVVGREPSTVWADFLSNITEVRLMERGQALADKASERAADASEQAGLMSGIGGLVGGLSGLF